jgi:hypothetical protein
MEGFQRRASTIKRGALWFAAATAIANSPGARARDYNSDP